MRGVIRFWDREGEFVPLEELCDWVREHPLPSGRMIPICIHGAAGIGKSQMIRAYCDERGFELRTYHPAHDVDGSDIVGRPYIDPQTNRTVYALPAWLPVESDPPGVLFIDEINRAKAPVLNGLMEPLGEGTISQSGWSLPVHWNIVAAANPGDSAHDVHALDAAMIDRFIHYGPGWDPPAWAAWAKERGLNPDVVDFALRNPDRISVGEVGLPLEVEDQLHATPRSLEYLATLLGDNGDAPTRIVQVLAHGLLGREVGAEFCIQWQAGERPLSFEQVVSGSGVRETLARWLSNYEIDLIRATNERVVAGLVGRDPQPNVVHALRHYLHLLDAQLRDQFMISIGRSAPAWREPLETGVVLAAASSPQDYPPAASSPQDYPPAASSPQDYPPAASSPPPLVLGDVLAGEWSDAIIAWRAAGAVEPLLESAELIGRELASRKPAAVTGEPVGRFLAALPRSLREEALARIESRAPAWSRGLRVVIEQELELRHAGGD